MRKDLKVAGSEQVPRRGQRGPAPLSFAQQRLWFLNQLAPDSSFYNIPFGARVRGPLDLQALQRALGAIVSRHEALRTTFVPRDGSPVQVISECKPLEVPVIDLSLRPAGQVEAEAGRLTEKETQRPFDLSRGPLFRTLVLRIGPEDHVLVLTLHHIVTDGWSMGILCQELEALYAAHTGAGPSPLPVLATQYADFAVWQRNWLQGEVLERQLAYWKRQLAGNLNPLELPADRRRPPDQSLRGAMEVVIIPRSLVDALRGLSLREGVTLFMTLVAAFQVLLYRYAGQEDIIVGTPIANRDRAELENVIGFFANTLVLRTSMSGNPTFQELLARVREVALQAYAHQDVPFEKLVEELRPERDPSRTPFFQVMFALTPHYSLRLPGLVVSPLETECVTAKFDLTMSLFEGADGLNGELVYNTDLFDAPTIKRMAGHFLRLLEEVAADPDRPISSLPILTEAERHQILVEWNDTRSDYPRDKCIHELFEVHAERMPGAVAVGFGDEALTYGDLNRHSNQLARRLQEIGVVSETPVGIFMERSLEMVVALLGVLKAGGAYVPLDPAYPPERLAFMLEDSGALALVTQQHLSERLPSHRAAVVILDAEWETISHESGENFHNGATAESLAYVMYTSGSTGKPKGVAVPHRAVNRLVVNTDYVNFGPGDAVAQVSNCSFDACTFEVWGALLNGARLVGIAQDDVLSPKDFAARLEQSGVTVLFLTTALFNHLAGEIPSGFGKVRDLLIGGEAADPRWIAAVLRHNPPRRLLNAYGPTEATTFATWYQVEHMPEGATTIPIGRPLANTQVYLLSRELEPVPVGVPGELHIGGDGLARGYLDRPDLTADRFIANPFSNQPGARLYKTGDLARYRPDGNIEFLGRIDQQVKLRGFRIELMEIEAVLEQHPAVRQVAVLLREDVPGDKRLVAYIVPWRGTAPTVGEMRGFLKARLPKYMVPSAFVMLNALPLAPNAKIDHRALPAPDHSMAELNGSFVAPRDELERMLARIWEKILGVHPIGIKENFFELGGHSLLAVRLLSQIERELGSRPPLATIFQAPTVEQLAGLLRLRERATNDSRLVPIQAGGSRPPFFCCHAGIEDLARHLGPDQPCYSLEPHGFDGRRAPSTVEEMAASYIGEMRALQFEGPYYLAGCSFGGLVAFEMAVQLQAQGQETALLALIDPTSPPDMPPAGSVAKLKADARRHLREIARLGLPEKLSYILRRANWRIGRRVRMAVCKAWLAAGRRVPPSQRGFYFYEVGLRSSQFYIPRIYPGRLLLFRTEENDISGWARLAAGGVEIYGLPGRHHIIFEEPYVEVLAEQLGSCLQKTQGLRHTSTLEQQRHRRPQRI